MPSRQRAKPSGNNVLTGSIKRNHHKASGTDEDSNTADMGMATDYTGIADVEGHIIEQSRELPSPYISLSTFTATSNSSTSSHSQTDREHQPPPDLQQRFDCSEVSYSQPSDYEQLEGQQIVANCLIHPIHQVEASGLQKSPVSSTEVCCSTQSCSSCRSLSFHNGQLDATKHNRSSNAILPPKLTNYKPATTKPLSVHYEATFVARNMDKVELPAPRRKTDEERKAFRKNRGKRCEKHRQSKKKVNSSQSAAVPRIEKEIAENCSVTRINVPKTKETKGRRPNPMRLLLQQYLLIRHT
jgi:hypothetical protein